MASWTKGKDAQCARLLEKIEGNRSVLENGGVEFDGFEHWEHKLMLRLLVCFNENVPELERRNIINSALFDVGAKGEIEAKPLMRVISEFERSYLKREIQKFRLMTTISFARSCEIPKVIFQESHIQVHAKWNTRVRKGREEILRVAKHDLTNPLPKGYATVSVSVNARSEGEAANMALDRLDFVRGVWNLYKHSRGNRRLSGGIRQPVNHIVLGPIHTLHHSDGGLATHRWWYEPQYQGQIKLYSETAEIGPMGQYLKDVRRLLQSLPHKAHIIRAVIRYVRALDSRDWEAVFVRLWGVLEFLTGTRPQDSHSITVRRASYICHDIEYSEQVLTFLRDHRNRSVHAGSESREIESLMYMLKEYVEGLIVFHINNRFGFSSISDSAEFMDLPRNLALIDRRVEILCRARGLEGMKKND